MAKITTEDWVKVKCSVNDCQGVRGVPSVERMITVSPSSRPAAIEVYYCDSELQVVQIRSNQEMVGRCGESIKQISKFLHYYFYLRL